jgi:hypothetical protein
VTEIYAGRTRASEITTRGADCCLWGYLKGTIYWKTANTRDELWRLIEATTTTEYCKFLASQGSAKH